MGLFDKFKRKKDIQVEENKPTNANLLDIVTKFREEVGTDGELDIFEAYLATLVPTNAINASSIDEFKRIANQVLSALLVQPKVFDKLSEFQRCAFLFKNYSGATKEDDGSYSLCPVLLNDKLIEFVINFYLEGEHSQTISEELLKRSHDIMNDMLHSKINTYYGNLLYIQERANTIYEAINMIAAYNLDSNDATLVEATRVKAEKLVNILNSYTEEQVTPDIYKNVIHSSFKQLVSFEKELSSISAKIWKAYFRTNNARFAHALSNGIVESDKMNKICCSLLLDDLATIPYGHVGYEYDFDIDTIDCICPDDAGSWYVTKQRFVGCPVGNDWTNDSCTGIIYNWQYNEETNIFYEFGKQSILLPPSYVEQTSRKNNLSNTRYTLYTEILLLNNRKKNKPIRAFYTDKASNEEIAEITEIASKQGLEIEYLDTEYIKGKMQTRGLN